MEKINELGSERFVSGDIQSLIGKDLLKYSSWPIFQKYWTNLEIDRYMNDGGTYRQRRFGRFKWKAGDTQVHLQTHRPYQQPIYFNPLNGGLKRDFAPVTLSMAKNPILQELLTALATTYAHLEDVESWKINTYFNRIVARPEEDGLPVPEGMHRDGVKFSCLFMVNRFNISGGETTLFDLMHKEPIFNKTLILPGQTIIFRDDTVFHDTTSIKVIDETQLGFRDILVIEFH